MKLWEFILELLFPHKCILCGKLLEKGQQDLCPDCRADSPDYPNRKEKIQFLDSFTAVWYYEGSVRRSLLRYKFYSMRSYADSYGRLLAMKVLEIHPEGFDCLTWVPVSRRRKIRRGYDQVQLLAKAVGRELGLTHVPLLKKVRHNRPQSGIADAAMRRANVLGAYRAENREQIAGKRILLLDDVLTTGSTAGECARVLLTCGAKEVHCAAIAAARK
jgi:ComF family protein